MNKHIKLGATALLAASFVLAGCNSPEEKEARYIKRGNELFEQGQYEKARIEYKNAARIRPTDPEVGYRIGLIDEAEGDFHGAFAGFTNAEQQDGHYHPALIKLAQYYLAAEQYDQVQKRLAIVLGDKPDDPDAHALNAALLLRQKNYEETEKEARFALSKDPANLIAYSVLIGLYSAQNDDAKAIAAADEGIARNPKSLPLLLLKTEIYERQDNLPKIAECYDAIFKLEPHEARFRVNLAAIYLKAGQIDQAEATLRAGVAALPDDWDMKHQLVTFLNDHRGMDIAEKEILSLKQNNPSRPEPTSWLVDLYLSHDATDRAVALLNNVIDENPSGRQGLDARTALARIHYIKGDRVKAEELAQDVLANDPNNLDALFVKAHVEADNGALQSAIVDLRTIVRDRPKAKEALRLLSEILQLQGHLDLAIDTLNQLVDIDPLNFAARVRLAQLYHLNGDSKHAMDLLFFVTKTEPKYSVGWESVARVAIDTKDWSTAENAIKTLETLDGQKPMAAFLRGQMLDKTGKSDDAILQYKKAIEADTSAPIAERALAALVKDYKDKNKLDEATHYIESLKSDNPMISTILGESYLANGKPEQAVVHFDAAISSPASSQDPYLDRARMLIYSGNTDEAINTLKKAAAAVPTDMRAPVMEAQILGESGRYKEAIALYENLLSRNPDLDGVANNLAEIIADYEYKDAAALDRARHAAERFVATTNPLLLDTLAWVYYRQGNTEEAQNVMQRAFSLSDKLPPQVHYHYGAILLKAGRHQDAKTELQQAIEGNAAYPGLDDAKKMLEGL